MAERRPPPPLLLYRLVPFAPTTTETEDPTVSKDDQIEQLVARLNDAEARLNRAETIAAAGGLSIEEKMNRLRAELLNAAAAKQPSPPLAGAIESSSKRSEQIVWLHCDRCFT